MDDATRESITVLLHQAKGRRGPAIWDKVIELLEREIKSIAKRRLGRERNGHTLQPTALVDEVFLKLRKTLAKQVGTSDPLAPQLPEDRRQLFSILATAMGRVLIDYARQRQVRRRAEREYLENKAHRHRAAPNSPDVEDDDDDDDEVSIELVTNKGSYILDVLDLQEGIEWVDQHHPGSTDILHRRFWLGQTVPEIATDLAITVDQAENIVRVALARLKRKIHPVVNK